MSTDTTTKATAKTGVGRDSSDARRGPDRNDAATAEFRELAAKHDELVQQMGDDISPFPDAGVDGFLSHFIMTFQFLRGPQSGQAVSFEMPTAIQTVARSGPFIYHGPAENHTVTVPLPSGCTLSDEISERDFRTRPEEYFEEGQETVWMQILNLDARMDHHELGPIRIILGETLKREHPDIFRPSLGVAQSLGRHGFPARLFFNPYALVETRFGSFRAIHGTLSYGRITHFPPMGTPVSIQESVPMEALDDVQQAMRAGGDAPSIGPIARIIALSHPIDVPLQVPGDEAFRLVEARIAGQPSV